MQFVPRQKRELGGAQQVLCGVLDGLGVSKVLNERLGFRIQKQKRKKLYRRVEILRFPFLGPFEFRLGHVGVPSSSSIFPELALARRRWVAASSNLTPGPRANDRGTTFGFQSLSVLGLTDPLIFRRPRKFVRARYFA